MASKSFLLSTWIILSLSISQSVYSNQPESCLLFSISEHNVARIGIINREKNNLQLSIYNETGTELFSQTVSAYKDFFKLISLSGISEGEYVVKLTGGGKAFEKKFTMNNTIASIVKEKEEIKPVFKLINEDILIISYFNAKNNKVNIFFEMDDNVVFEERNITGTPVKKKYSLKRLEHGEYIVKLYSGSKIYEYPLAVK